MKDLRKRFERFCLKNRDKGISNLMLVIAICNAAVYVLDLIDPSHVVYSALCFSREGILHGQVWRLFTYIFTYLLDTGGLSLILGMVTLLCYAQFGKILEQSWGRCRFNLYYFTGVLLVDISAFVFGFSADAFALNLSLFLAIATMAPDAKVLLMFIIPIKMKYMAWFYLGVTILEMVLNFLPVLAFGWLSPIIPLVNYFLFFGSSVRNILPDALRYRRKTRSHATFGARPNANWAKGYQSREGAKPYRHKCTVCGKTDADFPNMEFRYCSKCSGYYCYCMDHINNHVHITESASNNE